MCVSACLNPSNLSSPPHPASLPLPIQPLSSEVEARCTQTHPDAFNLTKLVSSVHMFRFLAWTKGKRLALYFGEKLALLTLDPDTTSRDSQESLQGCWCPGFGSPLAQRGPHHHRTVWVLLEAWAPLGTSILLSFLWDQGHGAEAITEGDHRAGRQAISSNRGRAAWGHLQFLVRTWLHTVESCKE